MLKWGDRCKKCHQGSLKTMLGKLVVNVGVDWWFGKPVTRGWFLCVYLSRASIRLVVSILSVWSSLISECISFWCRVLLESTLAAVCFFFLFSFSHWKHLMIKVDTSLLVAATHVLNKTLLNNYRNLINSPLNKFYLLGSHPVADTLTSLHEDGRLPSDSTLTSGVAWLFWVERGIMEKKLQAERLMKANESAKIRSQKHWSQWSLEGKAVGSLPLRTPRGAPTHHVQTGRDRWQH